MEYKKKELGNKLKNHINNIKLNPQQFIFKKSPCERLLQKIPTGINLTALKTTPVLIKDAFSKWPSFSKVLYANLDYDNLILYILFYTLFYKICGDNSIVAIAIVYVIEKILQYLR